MKALTYVYSKFYRDEEISPYSFVKLGFHIIARSRKESQEKCQFSRDSLR